MSKTLNNSAIILKSIQLAKRRFQELQIGLFDENIAKNLSGQRSTFWSLSCLLLIIWVCQYTVKKNNIVSPSPAGMSLAKLSLAGIN